MHRSFLSSPTVPLIRLEVEGMKHTVEKALLEHDLNIDEYVQAELERVIKPENIKLQVASLVEQAITRALEDSVKSFFAYGIGRQAIDKAVETSMKTQLKSLFGEIDNA